MQEIKIPMFAEIDQMSRARCESDRTRLRNEISFARGNAMWGGPSCEAFIGELRDALDAIDRRLRALTHDEQLQYVM